MSCAMSPGWETTPYSMGMSLHDEVQMAAAGELQRQ